MRTQIVRQPAMSANGDTLATMETFAREAFRPWADAFAQWRDSIEAGLLTRNQERRIEVGQIFLGCAGAQELVTILSVTLLIGRVLGVPLP